MGTSGAGRSLLPDVQRVFHVVADVRALRGRPERQRRRARAAVAEILGESEDAARAYGRPATRRLRWFLGWLGEDPETAKGGDRHWRRGGRACRLLRLLVSELYRLHREGQLDSEATLAELAPRRRQVLEAVLRGRGVKQIAWELGLSRWTVEEHVKALYRHFRVLNRAGLMARFVWSDNGPIPAERSGVRQEPVE